MTYPFTDQDNSFMRLALEEAKSAYLREEVPIGAVIIDEKERIVAQNSNRTRELNDPTAHAEIICIREACEKAGAQRIPGYTLYATLEPCTMCAAAISFSRISRVVFATPDPKGGGIIGGARFFEQSTCHHKPEIAHGLFQEESSSMLKEFFKSRR